mmetsp:Transcript_10925/g.26228  ORF Transcript_10925/g.26228 Transcript_10925/m.26228 type:complete len:246 (-) Transcript_10925:734-1471(-)
MPARNLHCVQHLSRGLFRRHRPHAIPGYRPHVGWDSWRLQPILFLCDLPDGALLYAGAAQKHRQHGSPPHVRPGCHGDGVHSDHHGGDGQSVGLRQRWLRGCLLQGPFWGEVGDVSGVHGHCCVCDGGHPHRPHHRKLHGRAGQVRGNVRPCSVPHHHRLHLLRNHGLLAVRKQHEECGDAQHRWRLGPGDQDAHGCRHLPLLPSPVHAGAGDLQEAGRRTVNGQPLQPRPGVHARQRLVRAHQG